MTLGPGWSAMVGLWPSSAIASIMSARKSLPKMLGSAYGQVNFWNPGNGERCFARDRRKYDVGFAASYVRACQPDQGSVETPERGALMDALNAPYIHNVEYA